MLRRISFCTMLLTTLFVRQASADYYDNCCPSSCCSMPVQGEVTLRHIEAKGIGYHHGYSTLEGFFALPEFLNQECWLPFVDLRGHLFNDGKTAANAGFGVRHVGNRIWGVNAYYDYRKTHHGSYNQMSFGLESLGQCWDFRLNGYFPLGKTHHSTSQEKFDGFKGHHLIIARHHEYAFDGFNAEIGTLLLDRSCGSLYAAIGPYYLKAEHRSTWGAEARVDFDFADYFRLSVNTSYDRIFKGIVQGEASIIFAFGPDADCSHRIRHCGCDCGLREKAFQRVVRHEIIAVDKIKKKNVAIDPRTKKPYNFVFVNNTTRSNSGTFEAPFSTLIQAQNNSQPNDIIYVYTGNHTSKGMNSGISLKNNQKLWGSGLSYNLNTPEGPITIPVLQKGLPKITNPSGTVITLANNNEVAGIHVIAAQNHTGIAGNNITNAFIHDNRFTVNGTAVQPPQSIGAFFNGSGGSIVFENNKINQIDGISVGLLVQTVAPHSIYSIKNNQFIATPGHGAAGIIFGRGSSNFTVGDFNTITIANNLFVGQGSAGSGGVAIGGNGFSGTGHIIIDRNTLEQQAITPFIAFDVGLIIHSGGNLLADVTNNVWKNSATTNIRGSFLAQTLDPSSNICLKLHNNTSDMTVNTYSIVNISGTLTADIANNVGQIFQSGTITPGTCQ